MIIYVQGLELLEFMKCIRSGPYFCSFWSHLMDWSIISNRNVAVHTHISDIVSQCIFSTCMLTYIHVHRVFENVIALWWYMSVWWTGMWDCYSISWKASWLFGKEVCVKAGSCNLVSMINILFGNFISQAVRSIMFSSFASHELFVSI